MRGIPLGPGSLRAYSSPSPRRYRIPLKIDDNDIYPESVKACCYAEGFQVSLTLYAQDSQEKLYLIDDWQSSLDSLQFDPTAIVEKWIINYGLHKVWIAGMSEIPESSTKIREHPIADLLTPNWESKELATIAMRQGAELSWWKYVDNFAPFEGLIKWQRFGESGCIDYSLFDCYNQVKERIKRLDPESLKPTPQLMSFLMVFAEAKSSKNWHNQYREVPAYW